MKTLAVPLILMFAGLCAAGAVPIDKTVATVRLTRSEVITVLQLRKQIDPLEAQVKRPLTREERKLVLDGLIAKSLIEQAAARDKVYASDAEVNARLDQMKKTAAQSLGLGRDLTDVDLRQMVTGSGVSWDEYLKNLKYQVLLANYARAKKKSDLEAVKPASDEVLRTYYDANKKDFFIDDYVKIRHIFIDTRALTSKEDRDKAAKRADDIVKELRGGASFDELVLKYSDDGATKYRQGDYGYISRADEQRKQLLGKDFFDAVFRLKKGETSGALQSTIGYHIVRAEDRFDAKLLAFDEKVPPALQFTVKEFIRQNLAAQAASDALTKALEEIVKDLRKQGEVKVVEDNLAW
ncbi:MAG: peptidylprolyl isomerase [Spirochaetes bacterium]|nr:peptidylprolyl isomerase [Spirochaetota bacterium]